MTTLQRPEGLEDTTPLPYELWQVMSLVDGHLSAAEVGRLAGLDETEVIKRAARVDAYVQQHQRLSKTIDDELYERIRAALAKAIGPVTDFVLEDTLTELGGREGLNVGVLVRRLSAELDVEQRSLFVRAARQAEIV